MSKLIYLRIPILLTLLLLVFSQIHADPETLRVSGTVLGPDGNAYPGATVLLMGHSQYESRDARQYLGKSDLQGNFLIEKVNSDCNCYLSAFDSRNDMAFDGTGRPNHGIFLEINKGQVKPVTLRLTRGSGLVLRIQTPSQDKELNGSIYFNNTNLFRWIGHAFQPFSSMKPGRHRIQITTSLFKEVTNHQ